jgi:phospholipid/cholesterol/gamma-HCH transport system ATP-binding protein
MQDTQRVQEPVKKKEDTTVVDIQQLKKSFGDNQVLKEMTLTLKKGENLVVLGKSGTGKSVLIKCLVGLIDIDEGRVDVLGNNISELKQQELNELRKKIGFLFQSGALYDSMTVRENLEFPVRRQLNSRSKEDIQSMVLEALEDVGLAEAIDKMPAELSGGMRKRISLARTLILKPEIMLYDEPTTGLDTITSKEISHLILEIQKKFKTSSIIITHDMECARIVADRVIILNDGKVIGEGTYDELKNSSDKEINAFFV